MKSNLNFFKITFRIFIFTYFFMFLSCSSSIRNSSNTPLAKSVNLNKFMGDWYVIANIPNFIEKDAFNSIESYKLSSNFKKDKVVQTTFTFNKGSFDGKEKTYKPTAFVQNDPSNAVWKMQFLWPIKADYRIIYVDEEYQETIIGRNQRDYIWIMARESKLSNERYELLLKKAEEAGYKKEFIRKVPQE